MLALRRAAKKLVKVILLLPFVAACAAGTFAPVTHLPSILPGDGWTITTGCQEGGCFQSVSNGEISFGLENYKWVFLRENAFALRLLFFNNPEYDYSIDPSDSFVTIANGQILRAKAIECRSVPAHKAGQFRSALQAAPGVAGYQKMNRWGGCIILFVNINPPNLNESFKLQLGGMKKGDTLLSIPEVTFYPYKYK